MKIFSADQIKAWDQFTIQHEPIASIDLMERASRAFVQWFTERYDASYKIGVVCGTGNNGGDGLAIARMLREWNYPVTVWVIHANNKPTEDFLTNLARLAGKVSIIEIKDAIEPEAFIHCDILIDAIFGSGLSRPVQGIYANVITRLNLADAIRIAVDVPSGMFIDKHSQGEIVKANHTVAFQVPKLAFVMPENNQWVGDWHVVDIGLNKAFYKGANAEYTYTDRKAASRLLKPRNKFDHKGKFGHALIIAGSTGKMGAATLTARAALRSGVGLLTAHIPGNGYTIMQTAVPEAMATIDESSDFFSGRAIEPYFDAIGIGPGLGQAEETANALGNLFTDFGKPMVIDADALNLIASNSALLDKIPAGSILTPHPGEFARLVGTWENDFDRLDKLKAFAKKINSTVVLKGAHTTIASCYSAVAFNSTGNPGMATGGSGDVLAGVLTALLAQGYAAREAAILGVYLHGLAGDLAAQDKGYNSLIAGDIVDFLADSFRKIA